MAPKKDKFTFSYLAVKFLLLLTKIFPIRWMYAIASFVVLIGAPVKWKRKKIALGNMKIVFPLATDEEREALYRRSVRKLLKGMFEIGYLLSGRYTAERILPMASASGLNILDSLVSRKHGALLYSGHFGNFPFMILWLAARGYPVAAVYKEAANLPDDFFGEMMRRFNLTPLKYKSEASVTISIIRALKEGKIVFIQNDQSHPDGIYVDFFGRLVATPAGPALLAKRVGAPVIPCYVYRDDNDHHHITVLPAMEIIPSADNEEFIRINTQHQTDWIAEILVRYPDEWHWLHNRWKRSR